MTIDIETWLTNTWFNHNILYFDGLLLPPKGFLYTSTDSNAKYKGQCQYIGNGECVIAFNPALLQQLDNATIQRLLSDTMLHEMIHQWLYQQGYDTHTHTCKVWIDECERLAHALNIDLKTSHACYLDEFPTLSTHIDYYKTGSTRKNGVTIFAGIEDCLHPSQFPNKQAWAMYTHSLITKASAYSRVHYPFIKNFECLIVSMSYAGG